LSYSVLAYGEVLWDLLPSGAVLGGAPFNFVYRVASLGERGLMVSRLGNDELGKRALEIIQALSLDTRYLQRDSARPTGTVNVSFDQRRNPAYTIVKEVAYDFIEPTGAILEASAAADCLCFGTLVQRSEVSRRTLGNLLEAFRGRFAVLDINLRPECYSEPSIRRSVERADILKLNDEEAVTLAGLYGLDGRSLPDVVRGLVDCSALEVVVVTLGERGALAASRGGEMVYHPAFAVEPVDSLGSGDAFTAAFVQALLEGQSLSRACRRGNALGAMVARQEGATQPIDPAELERFVETSRLGPVEETLRDHLVDAG
jgi:fructokinase